MRKYLPKLTGWQKVLCPGFDLVEGNIKSWRNDTTLVEATVQVDNDLSGSVIIDDFEFTNITVLHHDS